MSETAELAVVGAGPAGLAAAALAAGFGLDVALIDEQPGPGGQIYRGIETSPHAPGTVLGEDYWYGARPVRAFRRSRVRYLPSTAAWSLDRERELGLLHAGQARTLAAKRVILATGAIERPIPIPGWSLPGVMTAGGAQILLKTAGMVPHSGTVLAGSGPLLWLLAWQIGRAGGKLDAILDTTPKSNWRRAWPHLPAFAVSPYALKGLRLRLAVGRRFRVVSGVVALAAEGQERIEAVRWQGADGSEGRLAVDTLLLHQGVVPETNLAMAAGVPHRWEETRLCFEPVLDAYGDTEVPGIAIAGDGGGILGAWAAEETGRLAAVAAIRALRPDAAEALRPVEARARRALAHVERGRAFLDALFRPAERFRIPEGETLACRCEEIAAGRVIEAASMATGPNQLKAYLRCGMGPCQGRMCGLTVTELMAKARGVSPAAVGHYRIRPPVKPLTVAELAGLPPDPVGEGAVNRD